MKTRSLTYAIGFLYSFSLCAQPIQNKEKDRDAIKSMCGCFEVDFKFAETFSDNADYEFHDRYSAHASAELAVLVAEDENIIQIQHILVVGENATVKHWRQDWIFESPYEYHYNKDQMWNFHTNNPIVEGAWTQKVYQVDDSPRYEGTAQWTHQNGKSYWENSTDTPLPRREYTKRSDYNVMNRRNRHLITNEGWIHEQDNSKILRTDSSDVTLAYEKGLNVYTRVDNQKCQAAIEWWETNQAFWLIVRSEWDKVYEDQLNLGVHLKSEGKSLIKSMYVLNEEWRSEENPSERKWRKRIRSTIETFVFRP